MSQQGALTVGSKEETELDGMIATSTGTSHTLTVKVKPGDVAEISDSSLSIDNGDRVIWDVKFVDAFGRPRTDLKAKAVIQFSGTVLTSRHTGGAGGGTLSVDVLKEVETETLTEPYSVLIERDGTLRRLTFRKPKPGGHPFAEPEEPNLVITRIGKPPTDPRPGPGEKPHPRPRPRR